MRAVAAASDQPRVIVLLERLDRSALAALAYARTLAPDVTAVHIADGVETARLRSRWHARTDGIALDVIVPSGGSADRILAYLEGGSAGDAGSTIVVIPTVAPQLRWLYPLVNWGSLRLARRLRRRPGTAVIVAPYPV